MLLLHFHNCFPSSFCFIPCSNRHQDLTLSIALFLSLWKFHWKHFLKFTSFVILVAFHTIGVNLKLEIMYPFHQNNSLCIPQIFFFSYQILVHTGVPMIDGDFLFLLDITDGTLHQLLLNHHPPVLPSTVSCSSVAICLTVSSASSVLDSWRCPSFFWQNSFASLFVGSFQLFFQVLNFK